MLELPFRGNTPLLALLLLFSCLGSLFQPVAAAIPLSVSYLNKKRFGFPPYRESSVNTREPFGTGVGANGQKIYNWLGNTGIRSGSPSHADFYSKIPITEENQQFEMFGTTFDFRFNASAELITRGSRLTAKCSVYVNYKTGNVGLDPAPSKQNYAFYFFALQKAWRERLLDAMYSLMSDVVIEQVFVTLSQNSRMVVGEISEENQKYTSTYEVTRNTPPLVPKTNPFVRLLDLPETWPGSISAAFPDYAGIDPDAEVPGCKSENPDGEPLSIFSNFGRIETIRVIGEGGDKEEEETADPQYLALII